MAKKKKNIYKNRSPRQKQQTGWTAKEWKNLGIGAAAILIVALIVIFVPGMVKNARSNNVRKNAPENALLCNFGTEEKSDYRELALVDVPEGFELDAKEFRDEDAGLPYFRYLPLEEGAPIQKLVIQGGNGSVETLSDTAKKMYASFVTEVTYDGDLITEVIDGRECKFYILEFNLAQQEGGDPSTHQVGLAYIPGPYDDKCVMLSAENDGEKGFADRDALLDALKQACTFVHIAEAK